MKAKLLLLSTLACVASGCGDGPVTVARVDRAIASAPAASISFPADSIPVDTFPLNQKYGVAIDNASGTQLTYLLDRATELHVGWVKFTFRWQFMQPNGAAMDAGQLSAARIEVAAARQRGLNVLVALEGTPAWAQRCGLPGSAYLGVLSCGDPRYPPDDSMYGSLRSYVASLVGTSFAAYPYDVQAWSTGNEPNDSAFFRVLPNRQPINEYIKVFDAMAGQIHAYGGFVVAPELAQGGSYGDSAFLHSLLSVRHASIQAVGIHQYNTATGTQTTMAHYRAMINQFDPSIQLWLSEYGTNGASAGSVAAQTTHIAGQLDAMEQGGQNWDRSIYFRLQGPITDDYPYSWLVNVAVSPYQIRSMPFACMRWYAVDRYRGTVRPSSCTRSTN